MLRVFHNHPELIGYEQATSGLIRTITSGEPDVIRRTLVEDGNGRRQAIGKTGTHFHAEVTESGDLILRYIKTPVNWMADDYIDVYDANSPFTRIATVQIVWRTGSRRRGTLGVRVVTLDAAREVTDMLLPSPE